MRLGIIDKDEYRQHGYWQTFQKIVLPCASGFGVAAGLLEQTDVRRLAAIVAVLLLVMFLYAAWVAWSLRRHMVRELPQSLQSLLLFSAEGNAPLDAPSAEQEH